MTRRISTINIILCSLIITLLMIPLSSLAADDGKTATRLRSIGVTQLENGVKIIIKADGAIRDYDAFTLDHPPRIVFDLIHITSPFRKRQALSNNTKWVKRVRHYGYPYKVRVVLDTQKAYLSSFSADPVANGLIIYVGGEPASDKDESAPVITADPPDTPLPAPARVHPKTIANETLGDGQAKSSGIGEAEPPGNGQPESSRRDPVELSGGGQAESSGIILVESSPRQAAEISEERLTLKEIIHQALKANISLKSLREGTKSAIALQKISQTAFLPTLSANYQVQHAGEEEDEAYYLLLYGDFPPQDIYSFAGTATQPLFAGFSLINQYRVAKLGVNISKLNEKLLRQTVIFSAKQGYFSILKAQKLLTVSKLAVRQLDAHTTVASNFYQVGMIPLNDLLKAQVELANATQSLIVVQNGLNIAKSNLNLILRRDINAPIAVVDVTDYAPFDKDIDYCLKTAEHDRIEIKIAALDVKRKEREVTIAKKDLYPSVSLRATVYQRGDAWDANGGNSFLDGNSWNTAAVATWNFWEWGRSYQGIKARKAGLRQARLKGDDIFDTIRLEVKQAYLRTKEGEKNITTVEKAIEQAKENFRISEERYKEQMVTSTDVLDAQTLLSRTMTNYYNALYDFKISKASLYKAMGQEVLE
ncbi:MAG: TolC family protein [Desulfobacterales bacterium]